MTGSSQTITPEQLLELGNNLLGQGREAEARPYFAEAALQAAVISFQSGKNQDGIELLKKSVSILPEAPNARWLLTRCLFDLGVVSEALENLDKLLQFCPQPVLQGASQYAQSLFDQGNFQACAAFASAVLQINPAEQQVRFLSAKASLSMGQTEKGGLQYLTLWLADRGNMSYAMVFCRLMSRLNVYKTVFQLWKKELHAEPLTLARLCQICQHMYVLYGDKDAYDYFGAEELMLREDAEKSRGHDRLGLFLVPESYIDGIGPLLNLDFFVRLQKMGLIQDRKVVILASAETRANPYLAKYLARHLFFVDDPLLKESLNPIVDYSPQILGGCMRLKNDRLIDTHELAAIVAEETERRGERPLLTLDPEDEERAWKWLAPYGIKPGDWFVGTHLRGATTGAEARARVHRLAFRDVTDISTYTTAFESVTSRGGWIIRTGDKHMPPWPKSERVIDLTQTDRCGGLIDVLLWARSRFFVGSSSGPSVAPLIFGTPSITSNWVSFAYTPVAPGLFVPKLIWSNKQHRHFNFRELYTSVIGHTMTHDLLDEYSAELKDNTPDELLGAFEDMLDSLEGKPIDPEVMKIQQEVLQFAKAQRAYGVALLPPSFIRKHRQIITSVCGLRGAEPFRAVVEM